MNPTERAYGRIIERIAQWARSEEDVRAVIVIGSRARSDHPADEWADLDVIVITSEPERYLSNPAWVRNFGDPWLTFVEPTADGRGFERRVLFEGGLDVDFALVPVDEVRRMARSGIPPDVVDTLRRGFRVLVDKDGLVSSLSVHSIGPQASAPPTEAEFMNAVHDFWYHAVFTAKHLRRGELWWAHASCDGYMKRLLQRMIMWHAIATKGREHDTWFRGRFLEEWADRRAVRDLRSAFAHYDEEDVWRALRATMNLFRWLAIETAHRLRFPYPKIGDARATQLFDALMAGRQKRSASKPTARRRASRAGPRGPTRPTSSRRTAGP